MALTSCEASDIVANSRKRVSTQATNAHADTSATRPSLGLPERGWEGGGDAIGVERLVRNGRIPLPRRDQRGPGSEQPALSLLPWFRWLS